MMFTAALAACATPKQEEAPRQFTGAPGEVKLITLDPGHFHAALVQKKMYPEVSPVVHVYAPEGQEVEDHLARIKGFNTRAENPTSWETVVYKGEDFMEKMLSEQKGNVMVIAGNNRKKTEFIKKTLEKGIHVLADKPMAIDVAGFELLKEAFEVARQKDVLLYDIMTERYEITTMLQKELSLMPELFGRLAEGDKDSPAVTKESVHHFFKFVSGAPLKRPAWFFDVTQQGEGVVDVTTHLVDLVQWGCFPEQIIDYTKDVELVSARRWPTLIPLPEFEAVTGLAAFPDYLKPYVKDNTLAVYANGEIDFKINGVHARVLVIWNYRAPEGTGDTHYSIMKGTKATLEIRQGVEEQYQPTLYVHANEGVDVASFEATLAQSFENLQKKFPDVTFRQKGTRWEVLIPDRYKDGHEAHFSQVAEKYLQFLRDGKLPEWEVPNMLSKYYITTNALEMAKANPEN